MIMVIDIAQSFIAAFTPPPDSGRYDELCKSLTRVTDPGFVHSLLQQDDAQMLQAFIGLRQSANVRTDFAFFYIENHVSEDMVRLELAFDLA